MLRASQLIADGNSVSAAWNNPDNSITGTHATSPEVLKVFGDGFISGNLQVLGDIFADDISYDVNTCNELNVNDRIKHLNNDTNYIAFETDKMTIDASGTSIVLDDTAMTDKIVVTGFTTFNNDIKTGNITLGANIIHDGDPNTAIGFPANDTFTVQTGGESRIVASDTNTTIQPQLTIANTGAAPKLRALMGGVAENQRFAIQTTQANGNSRIYIIPEGSGTVAATNYSNSSDLLAVEQRRADIGLVGSEFRCSSLNFGPITQASPTPFTWRQDATEMLRLVDGNLSVNNTNTNPLSVHARSAGALRFAVKNDGQINLAPLASAPATSTQGDVYYDSTLKRLRNTDGTDWYQLDNHFRSGSGAYPNDYDILLVGDDTTPSAGAQTNTTNPATAVPQQGIVLKARGQIQWQGAVADGGPQCTIFRTTNAAELVMAFGWRNGLDGTNWQSSSTNNPARSAIQCASGAVKIYANPTQAGTAGSATGVTPIPQMVIANTYAEAKNLRGWFYPATGTTSSTTGAHVTNIICGGQMLLDLSFFGNPNNGGSSLYKAVYSGIISVVTGWNGSTPTCYITYNQQVAGNPPNVSSLAVSAWFYKASTDTWAASVPQSDVGNNVIGIQVAGYASGWVNADATLYILRRF